MHEYLFGRNAVRESLRAGRRQFYRLFLLAGTKRTGIIAEILKLAKRFAVPVVEVQKQTLQKFGRGHQGVALEASSLPMVGWEDALEQVAERSTPPFFLALDHLEDPQNLGAILRTANAVGVDAVFLPERRAVGITPTVVNASAGAAEHLQLAMIGNLVQVLRQMKDRQMWIVGVEMLPDAQFYHQFDFDMPLVLVLGSEGRGLTRLVRQTCDALVKIPMRGEIESLNVSAAAAVIFYEVWRKRNFSVS